MLIDLTGQIERVTYANAENGFTIAKLKVKGRRDLVTVTGPLMSPKPGEILKLQGEWSNHPKYGEQFKIVRSETLVPATVYGIEKYLASGFIKGIGPVMAKRLVERFGARTLDVIDTDCGQLLAVAGIGPKRLDIIQQAWAEQKQIRDLIVFLQSHGISAGHAPKIFKAYGTQAVPLIQANPYQLATDIDGIGFLTADRMAAKLGLPPDSDLRIEAGTLYMLHQVSNDGHVFFPAAALLERCQELLQVPMEVVAAGLERLAFQQQVVIEDLPGEPPGADGVRAVYLAGFHTAEKALATRLQMLATAPACRRPIDLDRALVWVQDELGLSLATRQLEAVRQALERKVLIITGGPGTGKTTIIRAIITILGRVGAQILLAAPTGRAAKRLAEAAGLPAKTIHRLLEYSYPRGSFQVNERQPLDCDLLVVDEASMIDVLLMHHLVKAIPRETTLILVGDINQLPSVGPGNVLGDIIASGLAPVVELTEIFRQARESLIIVNAHRINRGEMPFFRPLATGLEDFFFIEQENPEEAQGLILDMVSRRIPARFGFDPGGDIQVITPMHRGVVGTAQLNEELQARLNPQPVLLNRGGRQFKLEDKVMQMKNNYERGVFNGDIGRIVKVDLESQEITIGFEGRHVVYDFADLDEIALAYAISVHKSQGSEYPAVVLPLLMQHYLLLQRNLLYTAVTRGKRLVVIVGSRRALRLAVNNDKTQKRYTGLGQRLRRLQV